MEAVARQLATGGAAWSSATACSPTAGRRSSTPGRVPGETTVCTARPVSDERQAPWTPPPIDEVVEAIGATRPEVVFAAHVETAPGIMLPDDYVRAVAAATHEVGGLLVLDCVASGALWVDMADLGVDVLLSAPQKGWSGSPCAGFVMLGEAGRGAGHGHDLHQLRGRPRKWLTITEAYTAGATPYHATMPTDALRAQRGAHAGDRDDRARDPAQRPVSLGRGCARCSPRAGSHPSRPRGSPRPAWSSPITDDPRSAAAPFKRRGPAGRRRGAPDVRRGRRLLARFRLGLFGLDKLTDIDGTVERLEAHLGSR